MPRKGENIYRRKDGRWEGRVRIERKRYISVYAHSYGEVRRKVAEIRAMTVFDTADVTFEAASRAWLKHSETRIKPSSLSNYTFLLNKHILPYFKEIKLSDLSRHELHKFVDMKLTKGRLKRIGGISKKYLRDMVSIVKSVAAYAEQEYDIQNRIRYSESVKPEKRELKIPEERECRLLSGYVINDNKPSSLAVMLALYTGMRIGEICGLKWSDFDFDRNMIHVRRTVQRISDNRGKTYLHIGTPKTERSARLVPIAPVLLTRLRNFIGDTDSYVVSGTSEPVEPARLRKEFLHILKSCDLPHMKFHTLRHIFASSCIRQGFDVAAVSEMLGHSNKSMTLDRYTHSSMETKQKYMRIFKL